MDQDFGIFIGLTCVPAYSNLSFKLDKFVELNLNPCFNNYKIELSKQIPKNDLNADLYVPIHFSALGNFDCISLCLIDDFYFGNFHFKPYNHHNENKKEEEITNYQYQIINAIENRYSKIKKLKDLESYNFIGICKLKLNYSLIYNNNYEILTKIKQWLYNYIEHKTECATIISDSTSWNEFTLIFANNELNQIVKIITEIRKTCSLQLKAFDKSILFDENDSIQHIFVDSHTTYGISNNLLKNNSSQYIKYQSSKYDNHISIITKLQIKTGHGELIKNYIQDISPKLFTKYKLKFSDGRSDYTIRHANLKYYLIFWIKLINDKDNKNHLFSHIRKIHSNINVNSNSSFLSKIKKIFCPYKYPPISSNSLDYNTSSNQLNNLNNQFKFTAIKKIDNNLKKLNVSKELSNNIISAYTCFNDLLTDVTLFQYILDLKPLLINLENIINKLVQNDDSLYEHKSTNEFHTVKEVSKILFNYIDIWQTAFQNRFQESKRYGYNSDSKVEFNGGVHRLIQSFDLLYKLVVRVFQIPINDNSNYLPIATYGSHRIDISSTLNNLHINYIQLFQPEIFLTVLPKEALNQQLSRYYFEEGSLFRSNVVNPLIRISKVISRLIHEENNPVIKQRIFEFCTPENIKLRTNYIVTYFMWAKLIFDKEKIDIFAKWFWLIYCQTSENYNIDGSLRISILRRTLFDFCITVRFIDENYDYYKLFELFNNKSFNFLLLTNKNYKNISLLSECLELITYLDKNLVLYKIRKILNYLEIYAAKLLKDPANKSFLKDFKDLTVEVLDQYSSLFQDNKYNIIVRNFEDGKIIKSKKYSPILIDPHGGLFIIDSEKRLKYFKLRAKVHKDIQILGYNHKNLVS